MNEMWSEVEEQRRIGFWQRTYLQTLAQLQASGPPSLLQDPALVAREAGKVAAHAVRQLDEWQQQQGLGKPAARTAHAGAAGGDGDRSDDEDPDGGYLGS